MPLPSSELSSLLDDAKQHLNVTAADGDAELLRKIEAAVELVEDVVGPLQVLTATETVTVAGVLSRGPVIAVTAATYLGTDVLADVTVTSAGVISGVYVGTVVTYTYGRSAPTAAQRHVLMEMVRRAWRGTQQGYRPGYGDAPEAEGGPQPALILTRADREALAPSRFYTAGIA